MAEILVGTCSWTDPTLLASGFYPSWANTAEKRLRHYAQSFDIVEVDSTYYSMLSPRTARLWVERTPPTFVFNVKAFRIFTIHPTQLVALPKPVRATLPPSYGANIYYRDLPQEAKDTLWQQFCEALLPLESTGKLGVVLFQFPEWFVPGKAAREHIHECRERLTKYRLAIEFRNGTWLSEQRKEDTFNFLRENNLIYVCVDEPQGFRSSVPPVAEATSDIAVVRFHGRNKENWEKKGITVVERFKYLYSKEELSEWLPKLGYLASKVRQLHVLFNNCYSDYGVRNARDIDVLMQSQPALFPDYIRQKKARDKGPADASSPGEEG